VKKPVFPEKPAFNLPAGFFHKTWDFSSSVVRESLQNKKFNFSHQISVRNKSFILQSKFTANS
jgi:hypothetical protein